MACEKFFVLTGGPGAGKTSVIEELAARGLSTTREAGRAVIASYAEAGLPPPWIDPPRFAELMLDHDIAEYERAATLNGPVFFDRGMLDLVGYLALMGLPVTDRISIAAERYRYNSHVFLFPPWRDIYVQDAERHQDFAEAERTHRVMVTAYKSLGYTLIEVPRATIADRAEFIQSATRS
jgi:predicted ATPase